MMEEHGYVDQATFGGIDLPPGKPSLNQESSASSNHTPVQPPESALAESQQEAIDDPVKDIKEL